MMIPKRVLKACAKMDSRQSAIQSVYVDVEACQGWATNGLMLICFPIEPEAGDVSGLVPKNAIEAADKHAKLLKGRLFHGPQETSVPSVGSFPNPQEAFPLEECRALLRQSWTLRARRGKMFRLNVTLLSEACMALGETKMDIWYADAEESAPYYLTPIHGEGCAIVAPMSFSTIERERLGRMAHHCREEEIEE